ncbi:TetR/AcrR family transcriptional regulator [Mucilaginibacter gotjawali]|uniref:HTH-type transcriptional regulator RutR n=2 Tax=Mucilaginibacter gotjawali TaxID=1550579 RepID=A0A110B3D4_9SPHI|nr:TetR/AcrR family transcriptional regulator [Mucilaginibacter gotjawali]MBB3055732.1 TetR/AcrR family transcriptional repressor of mexJK operon [Mucilaginibacter gotjawali]BAU54553.1 HTH-type transcriptional regulator RutR [Mucilaginibacter gotjawali]
MIATNEIQDLKKEKILEAAHQRFLHYGYSKTTMNEIAGDLCMSKALLYYYFPDKSQLYADVMRRVADEYLEILKRRVNTFCDLKEAFEFQINSQHEFILKNYNFFDFFRLNEQNLPGMIWDIVTKVHQTEKEMLVNAIQAECIKGKIKAVDNPEEIVELLLDALHGVRMSALSNKKNMFPDMEHMDEIRKKRLLMSEIFIKGLMYQVE